MFAFLHALRDRAISTFPAWPTGTHIWADAYLAFGARFAAGRERAIVARPTFCAIATFWADADPSIFTHFRADSRHGANQITMGISDKKGVDVI